MHLSKKDCELYYQHQVGGNYFQGSPYQRGYGFFGDLRRYITPLALRAGKYLGNHLLQTGKNVVHDVAGGTSFKDSARNRLRETSKQIKDDFFENYKKEKLAIDSSSFVQIHPLASLSDSSPLEFYISGNGEHYLDLAHSILHLQIKILKKNDSVIGDNDHVAPLNYILNTMCLLFSSKSSQDSFLSSALFHKDTASAHDNVGATSTNEEFLTRKSICKTSKLVDLIGILHYDLAAQPKLLVNGVNVRIKLERQKDPFSLMASGDNYKICLKSACLYHSKN
ncbi:uncharacterized protein F54H12.2 [Trichonephila clavipes]|nr:uncharacterized protein F54H12.2 [Trichonephila clavipes]